MIVFMAVYLTAQLSSLLTMLVSRINYSYGYYSLV